MAQLNLSKVVFIRKAANPRNNRYGITPEIGAPAPSAITLQLLEEMVIVGGGRFRGVQNSFVLFDDGSLPANGRPSMAIKASELSADKVRSAIRQQREADAEFETFAEKCARAVFRQFSGGAG